jgi:hypothetical protein
MKLVLAIVVLAVVVIFAMTKKSCPKTEQYTDTITYRPPIYTKNPRSIRWCEKRKAMADSVNYPFDMDKCLQGMNQGLSDYLKRNRWCIKRKAMADSVNYPFDMDTCLRGKGQGFGTYLIKNPIHVPTDHWA